MLDPVVLFERAATNAVSMAALGIPGCRIETAFSEFARLEPPCGSVHEVAMFLT